MRIEDMITEVESNKWIQILPFFYWKRMGTTKENLNLVKGLRAKGLDIKRLFPRKFEVEGQKNLICRQQPIRW